MTFAPHSREDGMVVIETHNEFDSRTSVTRNNLLYLLIGALAVVGAVLGYQLYQEKKQPEGVQINLGRDGLTIEKK